jgi:phage terminase large subunit-like protein
MSTNSPALAPLGAQRPALHRVPEYVSTAGDEAIDLAARCGLHCDVWQADVLRDALGERADGSWAAKRVVVIVSRQNGKGSILEARVLAGLNLFGEKLIMWSAHEMKTAMEAYRRVEALIEANPSLRRLVKRYIRTNGNEGIEFRNGARLRFVARSKGSGRGFSCDVLILDEAYALTPEQLSALMPTMSARPNAQIWITSSPPLDALSGDVLFRLRDAALAGDPTLAYFDWGLQGVDLDGLADIHLADPALWAQTNPAYGVRISEEFTAQEFSSMTPADFARERLGVWPARYMGSAVIDLNTWQKAADLNSVHGTEVAFALDVTPLRDWSSIAAYGLRPDGLGHLELVDRRPGVEWLVDRLVVLRDRWEPVAIALDAKSPAASLVDDLERVGITRSKDPAKPRRGDLAVMNTLDAAAACGQFIDALKAMSFRHIDQGPLNVAVAGAQTRPLGDAFGWARRAASVDISPLCAATAARWAYTSRSVVSKSRNPLNIW